MSRPRATSRKLRRVQVLLALFLACGQAAQTARALLGAGAVPLPRLVPPGIWARNLLVARRAKADGTLDGGEAEDKEDVKAAQEKDDVEEATTEVSRNKAVDEAAQTADSVEDAKQDEKLQETVQETEEIKEDKAFDKPTEKAEDMYQQSVVLALKGWERAEKELESATEVLIFARSQWQKAVTDQNQEKQSTWDQNIKEAEKNVDKVKRDVDKAEEQFQKAAERLKEEEAKVSAAAPAQAVQQLIGRLDSIGKKELQTDESKGIKFQGRSSFFAKDGAVAELAKQLCDKRPANKKESVALVYSSVSGSGKTVSMLELKRSLAEGLGDVVVAYLGFNTDLMLHDNERRHIEQHAGRGAKEVLARRLLGSVIISNNNPDVITNTCSYAAAYGDTVIPSVEQSKQKLIEALGCSGEQRVTVIAGLDEVQLLNGETFGNALKDLGRFFLSVLREWQVSWWDTGLSLVPLATGVTLDFPFQGTTGKNKPILGDAVLVTRSEFEAIVQQVVENLSQNRLQDLLGKPAPSKQTVVKLIAAIMWPRVRLVEQWRDGVPLDCIADANEVKWPAWMESWLLDEYFACTDVENLPGKGDGLGRIQAMFQKVEDDRIQVVPDGFQASFIVSQLTSQKNVPFLYKDLDVVKSMEPQRFLLTEKSFEDGGFSVLGSAIHLGLEALRKGCTSTLSDTQKRRLGYANWFASLGVVTQETPQVLGIGMSATPDMYPYSGQGSKFTFCSEVAKFLKQQMALQDVAKRVPIFVRGGRRAPHDYAILYPNFDGRYLLFLVDAKRTSKGQASRQSVTVPDQIQLLNASTAFSKACRNIGFQLERQHVKVGFLTNRDALALPTKTTQLDYTAALETAQREFPGLKIELINRTTLEFEPFSSVLFARLG